MSSVDFRSTTSLSLSVRDAIALFLAAVSVNPRPSLSLVYSKELTLHKKNSSGKYDVIVYYIIDQEKVSKLAKMCILCIRRIRRFPERNVRVWFPAVLLPNRPTFLFSVLWCAFCCFSELPCGSLWSIHAVRGCRVSKLAKIATEDLDNKDKRSDNIREAIFKF